MERSMRDCMEKRKETDTETHIDKHNTHRDTLRRETEMEGDAQRTRQ
jgi:hypothetical protein